MGISYAGAQFLVSARRDGVSFERTLTLGRQDLFASPIMLTRLLRREGLLTDPAGFRREITRWPYRADPLFKALGARELASMDRSPYEGADVMHDLNQAVPEELHQRYDLVVDGGTLEHIFNFPVALKNVMEMVTVGGHVIFITPTNNYPGHGFYQVSPELYHQALAEENGYRVERILAIEDDLATSWLLGRMPVSIEARRGAYEIPSPRQGQARIEFTTTRPTLLFVLASRQEDVPIFASPPHQTLYHTLWEEPGNGGAPDAPPRPAPRPMSPRSHRAAVGLAVALHLAFGGVGRMLGPIRNLALARHYRATRLKRQRQGIKRSNRIRT